MAIELTREQEDLIQREMAARGYDTPSQVLDEALRMFTSELRPQMELAELRQKVRRSLEQADRGEFSGRTIPGIIAQCNRDWDAGKRG